LPVTASRNAAHEAVNYHSIQHVYRFARRHWHADQLPLDSFFGFANANTDAWLTDQIRPDLTGPRGVATFFRKIAQMMTYKESVLPHLRNVAGAGIDPAEVRARLVKAGAPG
jgi:hypothetical protein